MTVEEKFNEWLKRAEYQAQLLGIEIEFSYESDGRGYGCGYNAYQDVYDKETHKFFHKEGTLCINT